MDNSTTKTLLLKTAKRARKCTAFSTVWAAIYGCKGMTKRWHYVAASMGGGRDAEFVCSVCEAEMVAASRRTRQDQQQYLADAQAAAGVDNYRTQRVQRVGGVPTLIRG